MAAALIAGCDAAPDIGQQQIAVTRQVCYVDEGQDCGAGSAWGLRPAGKGARGDGTTDDTYAVQLALDFCFNNPGWDIAFTPGKTYLFNSAASQRTLLLWGSNVTIYGNGARLLFDSADAGGMWGDAVTVSGLYPGGSYPHYTSWNCPAASSGCRYGGGTYGGCSFDGCSFGGYGGNDGLSPQVIRASNLTINDLIIESKCSGAPNCNPAQPAIWQNSLGMGHADSIKVNNVVSKWAPQTAFAMVADDASNQLSNVELNGCQAIGAGKEAYRVSLQGSATTLGVTMNGCSSVGQRNPLCHEDPTTNGRKVHLWYRAGTVNSLPSSSVYLKVNGCSFDSSGQVVTSIGASNLTLANSDIPNGATLTGGRADWFVSVRGNHIGNGAKRKFRYEGVCIDSPEICLNNSMPCRDHWVADGEFAEKPLDISGPLNAAAIVNNYFDESVVNAVNVTPPPSTPNFNSTVRTQRWQIPVSDFNGDGRNDFMQRARCGTADYACWTAFLSPSNGNVFTPADLGDSGCGVDGFCSDRTSSSTATYGVMTGWFNNSYLYENLSRRTDYMYLGDCSGIPCWRAYLIQTSGAPVAVNLGNATDITNETPIYGVITGDFNGDHHTDFMYRGSCNGTPCWRGYLSNAAHSFPYTVVTMSTNDVFSAETPIYGVIAGDFNGDGLTDFMYRGQCGDAQGPDSPSGACWRGFLSPPSGVWPVTAVVLGRGDDQPTGWMPRPGLTDDSSTYNVMAEDFNGDGTTDFAYRGQCGYGAGVKKCWRAFLSNADESLPFTAYNLSARAYNQMDEDWISAETMTFKVQHGDFDGDGRADLMYRGLCGSGTPCWRALLSSQGTGGWSLGWMTLSAGSPYFASDAGTFGVVTGDYNGDGKLDFLYRSMCGAGTGYPCWVAQMSTSTVGTYAAYDLGDRGCGLGGYCNDWPSTDTAVYGVIRSLSSQRVHH
ncbi:MAG TPA: FG-GAP-like repeat-containing protein [Kofleriaceae bacterium]